jgi:hypothetical protein
MNVTIIRRAFWLIAALSLGYTAVAFWTARWSELLIAAGLFIICIPIDLFLAREEREHRARARTPFGPLIKSGVRTYSAEAPHWSINPYTKEVTNAEITMEQWRDALKSGGMIAIHDGSRGIAMRPHPRAPWWRRMYRRLLPWLACLMLFIPAVVAVIAAPPADALMRRAHIITWVVWTGEPLCVMAHAAPQPFEPAALCSTDKYWSADYLAPAPGEWVGVDPEMSGAETMSCALSVNGVVMVSDFGVRGDGYEVTCLAKWGQL